MSDDLIIPGGGEPTEPEQPSLHVDDDWKAQAQAEKEKYEEEFQKKKENLSCLLRLLNK